MQFSTANELMIERELLSKISRQKTSKQLADKAFDLPLHPGTKSDGRICRLSDGFSKM
jgi:hypothetical protein